MNKTNLDKLINLKLNPSFPTSPKEGDIINHSTGMFIYKNLVWQQLNGSVTEPDKCQIKPNSATISVTTANVVQFNNLTVGKEYRIESLVNLSQRVGSNIAISVHSVSAGPFGGVSLQKSNNGTTNIVETLSVYRSFTASETSHVLSVLILGAGTGGGTTSATLFEPSITELNFTMKTTDFT